MKKRNQLEDRVNYLVFVFLLSLEPVKHTREWKCKWLMCSFNIFVIAFFTIFINVGMYNDRSKGESRSMHMSGNDYALGFLCHLWLKTILVTQAIAKAERLIGYAIRLNVSILDTGQRIHLQPRRTELHESKIFPNLEIFM